MSQSPRTGAVSTPPPGIRLDLRRDAVEPSTWSVRFELARGIGWLRLPTGWGQSADAAARTGAAAGLHEPELIGADLMWRLGNEPWHRHPVAGGVNLQSITLGVWTPVGSAEPAPLLDEELELIDADEDPDAWSGELEETITELGRPSLPPPPAGGNPEAPATLVRALVLRIRQQEREISALREQIRQLQARLGEGA
jgi:hypothetical protein